MAFWAISSRSERFHAELPIEHEIIHNFILLYKGGTEIEWFRCNISEITIKSSINQSKDWFLEDDLMMQHLSKENRARFSKFQGIGIPLDVEMSEALGK